jgi:hypothetical protein
VLKEELAIEEVKGTRWHSASVRYFVRHKYRIVGSRLDSFSDILTPERKKLLRKHSHRTPQHRGLVSKSSRLYTTDSSCGIGDIAAGKLTMGRRLATSTFFLPHSGRGGGRKEGSGSCSMINPRRVVGIAVADEDGNIDED